MSDPQVRRGFQDWLSTNPDNELVFREIRLRKERQGIPCTAPRYPETKADLAAVLRHAETIYRHFVVAWLHPERLATGDALRIYYSQLTEFRRGQYEVYQFRGSTFVTPPADVAALSGSLWQSRPGAAGFAQRRSAMIDALADAVEEHLDLDALLALTARSDS